MAQVTVNDPEMVVTKKVDKSGKAYVTNGLAGQHVRIVVERVDDPDPDCE